MAARARSAGFEACARLALGVALALFAAAARAETAWVNDQVRLNLRTGPGVQFRIIGAVETGDSVQIVERGEAWTKVLARGSEEGWIPAGYLQPDPPARVALAESQQEARQLQQRLETLSREVGELRAENESLAGRDAGQREEIERLTRENLELRAGARWPEWIAGACLLSAGMLLGAILHRNAARRPGPRVRL